MGPTLWGAQTCLKSSLVTSLSLLESFMCFLFYLTTLSAVRSDEIPYALCSQEDLNSESSCQDFKEEPLTVKEYTDFQGEISSFCGLLDNI